MDIKYISEIRSNFPILNKLVNGYNLSYLDNAAMTQVPNCVVNSLNNFYCNMNSNIHRATYTLSEETTEKYEYVRFLLNSFFNGESEKNFIFVKNTTEGINLVANSFLRNVLNSGDEVLISGMEHHSNIIPWYILCKEKNAFLKVLPILKAGGLDYSKICDFINCKTKFIALTHVSNSLGTVNDIKIVIDLAHKKGIPILIDGAQSFSHCIFDLKHYDCDFYAFSSHKMYGPNGLGFLYCKTKFLNQMVPYQSGGDMVKHVSFDNIVWNDVPYKFEAGTQTIANVVAFGELMKFLNNIDLSYLYDYKFKLFDYLCNRLYDIKGIKFLGSFEDKSSIISFNIDNIHPHDFGTIANHFGVAVRTGHHCSIPVMNFYGISSSIRVSLSFYNTKEEIDALIFSILETKRIFS